MAVPAFNFQLKVNFAAHALLTRATAVLAILIISTVINSPTLKYRLDKLALTNDSDTAAGRSEANVGDANSTNSTSSTRATGSTGYLIWVILLLLLITFIVAVANISYLRAKTTSNFWVWYAVACVSLVIGFYLLLIAVGRAYNNKRRKNLTEEVEADAAAADSTGNNGSSNEDEVDYYEFEPPNQTQFAPLNKKRGKKTVINQLDYYASLTSLINDNDFQVRYVEAVRANFNHKRRHYSQILRDKAKELSQITGQHAKTPYGTNQKDENVQSLKNLITELSDILVTIKNMNYDNVIANLREVIDNKKFGLASLLGREEIKQHICKQILAFANKPVIFSSGHQNIILVGSPGSGKTTCARALAYCYNKSGIFVRDRHYPISTNELLSAYVNESTNKTRNTFYSGLEGLVFLDEAYQLIPRNPLSPTHADDAITELVGLLHEYCGKIIFMMAGYESDMQRVLKANQGLNRRFPHKIKLEPYSWQTLTRIFAAHVPTDVRLDSELLCSLVKDGTDSGIFVDQAGTAVNICNDFLTLYYSALPNIRRSNDGNADLVDNSNSSSSRVAQECLVNAFNGYYPDYHVVL